MIKSLVPEFDSRRQQRAAKAIKRLAKKRTNLNPSSNPPHPTPPEPKLGMEVGIRLSHITQVRKQEERKEKGRGKDREGKRRDANEKG